MWITKPFVAIVSGAIFVISVLLTAIGTAVFLAVDIPEIAILSDVEIINIIVISTIFLLFSASLYTFQQYAVIQDLKMRLDDRRDMQEKINHLAQLRSRAINHVYAKTPTPDNYEVWENEYFSWKFEVQNYLEKNFPFALVEMFTDLGVINPINFLHASSDQRIKARHIKILQMLVKELTIIESPIRENTSLSLESNSTLLELMKWQEEM